MRDIDRPCNSFSMTDVGDTVACACAWSWVSALFLAWAVRDCCLMKVQAMNYRCLKRLWNKTMHDVRWIQWWIQMFELVSKECIRCLIQLEKELGFYVFFRLNGPTDSFLWCSLLKFSHIIEYVGIEDRFSELTILVMKPSWSRMMCFSLCLVNKGQYLTSVASFWKPDR